jgi:hypothetical protein
MSDEKMIWLLDTLTVDKPVFWLPSNGMTPSIFIATTYVCIMPLMESLCNYLSIDIWVYHEQMQQKVVYFMI